MHEIISIQIGQCGNQIGNEFWKRLHSEHKIATDGVLVESQDDRKDVFFYQSDDSRYIPRAVLIDSEPRVISQSSIFYNHENIFVPSEGGGAGNNWAHGYYLANSNKTDIIDVIQREAEACDSVEAFYLMHSVAGGTGSGFSSVLLENMRDMFPKKVLTSFSILPTNQDGSDVVVQPYNTVFALNYLNSFCDNVVVMDNSALARVTIESTRIKNVSIDLINSLISSVLSSYTSTIRFPTHMYCDNKSILSCTVPIGNYKFLIPSLTPFSVDGLQNIARATSVNDVLRKLNQPKSSLCSYENSATNVNLSVFNILEGVKDAKEISRFTDIMFSNNHINFAKGIPPYYLTAISRKPSLFNRVSGLSVKNTSGFSSLVRKISNQFDQLKKRNAFVEIYRKYDADNTVFEQSREAIQSIYDIYEGLESNSPNM